MRIIGLFTIITMVFAGAATAQVTLPLDGYFRPGSYMPVYVVADGKSALKLSGPGIVPFEISSHFTGIAPVLALSASAGPLRVESDISAATEFKLRPLRGDEKLVVIRAPGEYNPQTLFPDSTVVTLRPDPDALVNARSLGWQSVDAVIFESVPSWDALSELLSSGAVVAVRSDHKPDAPWPFRQIGEYWVLRHELTGPKSAISEGAYLPTQTWRPTASTQFRKQIILVGVAVSLVALGTLLIRPARGQIIAMLAIVIVSCVLIELWRRRQPPTDRISGAVISASGELLQSDRWDYLAARSETTPTFEVKSPPILYGIEQAERTRLRMQFDDRFAITWTMSLPANSRMALLDRRVTNEPVPANVAPGGHSSLGDMARQLYLRPGLEIKGEQTSPQHEWGTVVIGDE